MYSPGSQTYNVGAPVAQIGIIYNNKCFIMDYLNGSGFITSSKTHRNGSSAKSIQKRCMAFRIEILLNEIFLSVIKSRHLFSVWWKPFSQIIRYDTNSSKYIRCNSMPIKDIQITEAWYWIHKIDSYESIQHFDTTSPHECFFQQSIQFFCGITYNFVYSVYNCCDRPRGNPLI